MFVNMLVSVVPVPEAGAEILLVKLPTSRTGDHITVLRPITLKDGNRTSFEAWQEGLSDAFASCLGELTQSWGEARDGRRKLFAELATTLAADACAK